MLRVHENRPSRSRFDLSRRMADENRLTRNTEKSTTHYSIAEAILRPWISNVTRGTYLNYLESGKSRSREYSYRYTNVSQTLLADS